MNFSAALLAGGRSSRMGRDKAFLDWQGRPLWRVQLEKLLALQPAQLFLAAREEQNFAAELSMAGFDSSVTLLNDPPDEDCGPIAAIERCVERAADSLLVLAVDMPLMTSDFLRESLLSQAADGRGVVARVGDAFEPLAAVYSRRALPFFQEALVCESFALQPLIRRLGDAGVASVIDLPRENEILFANVNTPASLLRLSGS